MEPAIEKIHQALQRLIGLHRQLLDTVRMEHEALVQADLTSVRDTTLAKQAVIDAIRVTENERVSASGELAVAWKRPVRDLTLSAIIITIQGFDAPKAEALRTALNALTILIKRVTEQNEQNQALVEKSLEHIHNMKRNVLGEAAPRTDGYNQKGQKTNAPTGARLLSKEA